MIFLGIYLIVWVRDSDTFLLCGWLAAGLWLLCYADWDGACGTGRRLSVSPQGFSLHYLAPASFQIFQCSLISLPDFRNETDFKVFFAVVFLQ